MASSRIDINVTGKDSTAGAFNSTSANIKKMASEVRNAGSSLGNSISAGADKAAGSIRSLGVTASSTFGMIKAGASAASSSIGDMGGALAGLAGGFSAATIAQSMWAGSTSREFNKMYLSSRLGADAANKYLDVIQDIVAVVPGDDTWMNSLLTGALARETNMNADQLNRLGVAASKYVTAAQATGASLLPANAQRELTSYINTGNTGLMVRDGLLKGHIEELEKAKTPTERLVALEKAMTEDGYLQLDTLTLTASKWETIKGTVQKAATELGMKILPTVSKALDIILDLDSKTNGWSTTIAVIGAGVIAIGASLGGLAILLAPIITGAKAAAVAMWSYANAARAGAAANAGNKGPGGAGGGVVSGVAGLVGIATVAYGASKAWEQFNYSLGQTSNLGTQASASLQTFVNSISPIHMVGNAIMGVGTSLEDVHKRADNEIAGITGAWTGLKTYVGSGITGTVTVLQNGWGSALNTARQLYNYVAAGARGVVQVITSGISSAWSSIQGLYNTVRQGATGVVTTIRNFVGMGPARGPAGPLDDINFRYESYGGAKKNAWTGSNSMSGNCVDMTEGLIGRFGGSMVEGTWNGGPHVWWKSPGGQEYDPARKALNNTYRPPARGPGDGGSGVVINVHGDIYDGPGFDAVLTKHLNNAVVRVF